MQTKEINNKKQRNKVILTIEKNNLSANWNSMLNSTEKLIHYFMLANENIRERNTFKT